MKIDKHSYHKYNKKFLIPAATLALTLVASGAIGLGGQIWADRSDMTRIQFSNALFCQRVSQAINDSLGVGMADGSDCVNFNLYVSTAEIGNIRTLNIVPPEGGFGNIDWDTQSMSIAGGWTNAFYNLTSLSITNMPVESISPLGGISGDLTYLDLSNNRIHNITPLQSLKDRLVYLDLSGNQITEGTRELSAFTKLTTLKLAHSGVAYYDDLFSPADIEYDPWTGEPLSEPEMSSNLAKVLQVFDISDNEAVSMEKEENQDYCYGNLATFETYADELAITELYASKDNLTPDDLLCIANLKHLSKLDVSNNHIDSFVSIKNKTYTTLKADSQVFTRTIEGLDYRPLPTIFTEVQQENYFTNMPSASNEAVALNGLSLSNAKFHGMDVRFVNAAIASLYNETPQPATVAIPDGTGVFENSRLEVYFSGQVVTFNDSNLCNSVYLQGATGIAFSDGWDSNSPVVITNACNEPKKQIAMISGGSDYFKALSLDSINDGAAVDLTGLGEFRSLEALSLKNNGLTDLSELANAYQLDRLWLDDNDLSNDDWSIITDYFTGLGILSLNNNFMSVIPAEISNLTRLGNLNLVNNGISDVSPLAYVPSLTALDLSENSQITDFSGMVQEDSACNPSILKLENAGVTSIPDASIIEAGFPDLISLNLNGNQITDDTISNLARAPKLEELYLQNNQIMNTSGFSGITSLKKLFLDNNRIAATGGLLPLTRLVELHLSSNGIGDITGLNTLPALATLDIKNQTLNGGAWKDDGLFELPIVFTQAMNMSFPRISGFQSAGNYIVVNGTLDYDKMEVIMTDTTEAATVTIPDGGLAGTIITITYGGGNHNNEFIGTLTDGTNGGATIVTNSSYTFSVTSDQACMALWTLDNGTTWNRLESSPVAGNNNAREFSVNQLNNATIKVSYVGDANSDSSVNVRDARKIVNVILGKDSLSSLEAQLADVDGKSGVNIRDARAIINSILGKNSIDW